ncbi:MAG: hypothetical protein WCI74_19195, partial [Actinomycetes bacterium]
MAESSTSEPSIARAVNHAPAWGLWLLRLALPIAILLELAAVVVAGVVFPLFDVTPLFVLAVVLMSWRWAGVSKKWFRASAVVAAVVLVEWIAWATWYYFVVYEGSLSTYGFDQLVKRFGNPVVALLLLETFVLLVVFGRACILSLMGIKRARARG